MSSHHGHHRSSSHHSRSRAHHSSNSHYQSMSNRSRTSSSNANNDVGSVTSNQRRGAQDHPVRDSSSCEWQECRSSSGKVYYYNQSTGVSQWEIPSELRQQRPASPESELSESSSIRQQQDKSPSSSASSHNSGQSDSVSEDKPLLTPGLGLYFKPELIIHLNSSQVDELENQANQAAKDVLLLSERILKEQVEVKISGSQLCYMDTKIEAQQKKYYALRETIERFGLPSYQ